jgi:hypothetical protein
MPFTQKQLVQKGYVAASPRAALVGGHTPPVACPTSDYSQLPAEIKSQYHDRPETIGRVHMHKRKG